MDDTTQTYNRGSTSPLLVILLVIPLLGILGALLMVAADLREQRTPSLPDVQHNTQTLINTQAPDFALRTLDGDPVQLADYRGQTVFVNFWQTTCAPCVEELPEFVAFGEDYNERVHVLAVNFDETNVMVREFFAMNNIIGVNTVMDTDGAVKSRYGVLGLPTTFIINPEGIIRFVQIGPMDYDTMLEYLELTENTDPNV